MITLDRVYHASHTLKMQSEYRPYQGAEYKPDCDLYLKTENLQITGSFKVRGAYYKISQLSEEDRAKE